MNVAIIGASDKPERYSYQALCLLRDKGHTPYPVHPSLQAIERIPVHASLRGVPAPIDTVTVYLSPRHQEAITEDLLTSGVRRVIFNPGTENPDLAARLRQAGIETVEACTLVLLATGQF